jgi:hypothetical protein
MSMETIQEGEFKVKKRTTPKKLNNTDEVIKVDLTNQPKEAEVIKVVIPSEKQEIVENPEVIIENTTNPVVEITEEEEKIIAKEVVKAEEQISDSISKYETQGKKLPENVEKLISFMEETGGTVEDYVRLNVDYSNIKEEVLLKEYYKKTKPYLSNEEIDFTIEDSFYYDEDLEEERDIKKKKLAFKEEVQKAREFLDGVKGRYYDEIKLRQDISPEKKEAMDFFNRYKKDQDKAKTIHEKFRLETKGLFNNEFKGFEFGIGEKKFRYAVTNTDQVAENQSDISNFVGKFLDKEGNVTDTAGYHKALYSAMNADKIAQHFYEQGKADAVKEVISSSKNPSGSQPRQAPSDVFINGLRVKSVSGYDSSKLRIKTKKFN